MKLSIKLLIFLLVLSVFISACTQNQQLTPPNKKPSQPEIPPEYYKQCFNYIRNSVAERYCAACGDNICEPFETCVPSECNEEGCTTDCGQLYCPDDCKERSEDRPSVVPKLPEITATLRTCNVDSDCVRIEADCCGCSSGGTGDTINKRYLENWQDTIESKCQGVMCPAVMSNHWSCTAKIKCVLNKCKLVRNN